MNQTGNLYIISAPSGTGKTTLCRIIMDAFSNISYSVSHTTRSPRNGEVDGIDYHFVSKDEFKAMVTDDKLAEWAEVHGNFYGTSVNYLNECLGRGDDILLDIDVKGAKQILKKYPNAVTIFIMPPSMEALKDRLETRGTDPSDVIEKRLINAKSEISEKNFYKHIVINDDLETAGRELTSILKTYRNA